MDNQRRLEQSIQGFHGYDEEYVAARDLLDLIESISRSLEIHWDAKVYQVLNLFISQYSDIYIYKKILLEFINDLLQVDILEYANNYTSEGEIVNNNKNNNNWYDESNDNSNKEEGNVDYSVIASSPLLLNNAALQGPEFDTIRLQEEELREFDQHINSKISSLNGGNINTQSDSTNNQKQVQQKNKKSFVRSLSLPKFDIMKTLASQFVLTLFISSNYLLIPNAFLLLISSIMFIHSQVDMSPIFIKVLNTVFLYETSKDLYWWQMLPFAEEYVWKIIDHLKLKQQEGFVIR